MNYKVIRGDSDDGGYKIGIVVARWNSFITDKLLEGALNTLKDKGYNKDHVTVAYCPGAYEIPLTAGKLLKKVDGVITLGAVIRGETPHFEYVCDAANRGITDLNMETGKPVVFGVLTTDNVKQARERSGQGTDRGNKGTEAALALLEMLSLSDKIDEL